MRLADRDLDLPTFLDDFPRVSFVIGAFEKTVESVVVTRDTGETFTATLHDTHAGRRPVVAVVNLGAGLRSQTPNATAVVTDTKGRVVKRYASRPDRPISRGRVNFYNSAGCTHLVLEVFAAFTRFDSPPPGTPASADAGVTAQDAGAGFDLGSLLEVGGTG